MSVAARIDYLTPEEYLVGELVSAIRHEYVQGQIYPMVGVSDSHALIAGNLFARLWNHLKGGACRVYLSDMKVRVDEADAFYYPDIMVTRDERDRALNYQKRYPCLIAEILSPSTAALDKAHKMVDYRSLSTLQEYVLIEQQSISVQCHRRDASGRWSVETWKADDEIRLESVGFSCAADALYENVILHPDPVGERRRIGDETDD